MFSILHVPRSYIRILALGAPRAGQPMGGVFGTRGPVLLDWPGLEVDQIPVAVLTCPDGPVAHQKKKEKKEKKGGA